ncbi:hypothetical protein PHYSODRAFT_325864 [Phytophthora sojae]|uniref:Uncharacterized protein n=1 Tax=Phytophthora sojae (strain P6497) TaxID=1094619 RepID=G4YTQ4_PHYSP|nr:hypothetical protein PHYSODRAFT_325864 [Phytophthora sojae]EGZ24791.1 hypothetical protein PHYSODRAFT_325864 [Phytophthora sojae]|eukprot:XP_009520079.1 hypothetical protein PHYSODRAFT_325864 [Phytophthora sojae]
MRNAEGIRTGMRPVSGVRRAFLHCERSVIQNLHACCRALPATQASAKVYLARHRIAKFSLPASERLSGRFLEGTSGRNMGRACRGDGAFFWLFARHFRKLRRILLERRTRRFLDEMIHKYADIRLSARTKGEMSRKRRRSEATGVLKSTNGCSEMAQCYGDRDDHSTSSSCRTESEQSSRLSSSALLDSERQSRKGRERQQQQEQQDEYRWRMSDARTVSEYGSAFSSTRLTSLLEEEDVDNNAQSSHVGSRRGSDSSSTASKVRETEENLDHCCGSSECESSSTLVESAPTSTSTQPTDDNQAEDQSEMSGSQADTPPASSSETLPRLRPTPPEHRVVPNCCDFFPSPHPHYAKEVIGGGKCEGATSNTPSPTNDASPDTQSTNQDAESANSSSSTNSNSNSGPSENSRARHESNDDFEMWDYICPQHARRNYANEWF